MATIKENATSQDELRLIVRKAEGEEPFLDLTDSVKLYEFKLNSNDGALIKDNNIMAELTIRGEYTKDIADMASKFMAEWAMETTGAAYKYVELIRFNEEMIRKRYVFPNAFVVDYDEEVETANGNVIFKLYIKQMKDKRTAFKMFVNESLPAEDQEVSENE